MYKVTFTNKGYVVGIFFNRSETESEAIESAKLYVTGKWSDVRAERV